ncbi:MAG: hypothetical protein R3261_01160 [Alphaproteobacteria bacterium]|nr:hypothetical protein [Alphaproteobacteria bacterium]
MTPTKLKERAIVLPALAFVLLTPPILMVFNIDLRVFGFPVLYFYAFLIWAILLIFGHFMAKQLSDNDSSDNRNLGENTPHVNKSET